MRPIRQCPNRPSAAFTLLEAMIAVVILSIAGVAVAVGLQSATRAPIANDRALAISAELDSEMENWKAVAWGSSPWPASFPYSATNTVTLSISGQSMTYNRTVSIQTWDPNNLSTNSAPQADFARVLITIDAQSAVCFFTKPL